MTNYWDKIGRKLNKKERFNYVNNRIDAIIEELGLNEETENPTQTSTDDENLSGTDETGELKVTVKDNNGGTVEGCTVTLTDTEHEYTGTTGSAGGCTIRDIPVGAYTPVLTKEGYDESQRDEITIQAGENTIEFILQEANNL